LKAADEFSMFISLKTRHLERDSNNKFHIFLIFPLVGHVLFFHETMMKKVDPKLR